MELSFSLVKRVVSVLRRGRLPWKFPEIARNFLIASTGQKNIPIGCQSKLRKFVFILPLAGRTSTVTDPTALNSLGLRIVSFR